MYKIIGGDKKEYGPVTADQLIQWISEGRANAQTLVQPLGGGDWKPLGQMAEFAETMRAHESPLPPPPIESVMETPPLSQGDYELDLGGCLSRGMNVVKANMGTLIGAFLILIVISLVLGGLINFIMRMIVPASAFDDPIYGQVLGYASMAVTSLVIGPLMGGFYAVILDCIRGQITGVDEVFSGFQKAFVQLFLGHFVVGLLIGLCFVPFNYLLLGKITSLLQQLHTTEPSEMPKVLGQLWAAFVGTLPVFLICLIPMIYLSVSWLFTVPLIVDRNLSFGAAMKTSWKMVGKHWWQVFGLLILIGLLNVVGFICCFVGLIFTIPVGFAARMIAYEVIFSGRKS